MANSDQLFSAVVSDIKSYAGNDPLLPWLQGIRKMNQRLPPNTLKEKLPRFLQRCAHAFESDRRYRNDLRYLRVWILLMDFVENPKLLLRRMEENQIGAKRAIFYQAYALYYEKLKKFQESDRMYHLGVQNLAEPIGELQKSYEQFLHRMELYKKKKTKLQEVGVSRSTNTTTFNHKETNPVESNANKENIMKVMEGKQPLVHKGPKISRNCRTTTKEELPPAGLPSTQHYKNNSSEPDKQTAFCSDDTVVVKFVGSAIVGKAEAEEACHHGLVDPTINMKEAMNAINSMFCEPLEPVPNERRKRSNRSQSNLKQPMSSSLEVFVNESCENGAGWIVHPAGKKRDASKGAFHLERPQQETFEIFCDDGSDENDSIALNESPKLPVHTSNSLSDQDKRGSLPRNLSEDTAICRFMGSTIFSDSEVENACHHGLVDPTINMKEVINDINRQFGKPLDFSKVNRPKKQVILSDKQQDNNSGFSIFTDDDLGQQQQQKQTTSCPSKSSGWECDLFEPTVFTKEAMDEINEMFGRPLDF
ncbi:hypothetical protein ACLOJK_023396 [Asimina triloba]